MLKTAKFQATETIEFEKPTRFFFHYWRIDNKVKIVWGNDPDNFDENHRIIKNVEFNVPTKTKYQLDKSPSLIVQGKCTRIEYDADSDTAIIT